MSERCLCIDLRSAAQTLTQSYDEAMAASGLSVTQFSQLNLIRTLDGPTLTLSAGRRQFSFTEGYPIRVEVQDVDFIKLQVLLELKA